MEDWDLYLVTEEELSSGRCTLEVVKAAINGGVDLIQLRDKGKDLAYRYELGLKIRELTAEAGVDLIINNRVDLALALEADGVHLGQDDLPLKAAQKLLPEDKIIGISASTVEEALQAEAGGADYLGVGSIFATDSKDLKNDRSAVGLNRLAEIKSKVDIPVAAIGGLNQDNISEVIAAGADVISVISAVTQAEDIEWKTEELKGIIKEAKKGR
ncbi:thiamine phosphate synthase [Acetohalobium arabaticum]|uniref:Thiamine-phosphate synthase n=1 Tax=Acetohalobium arabaticum (strain ATCC 49924 / DSM 5501 / Z-7288) TaxID=574087 RepID=D9QT37_ACEAZ|nr:thiamine phosphate synthase [Acetohalobium arabaticum]ADL13537.1 thiamine-phosphate diphosphorylase [Acetohalobium arabaticum DSM 5501]